MALPLLYLSDYQGKVEECFGTDASMSEAYFEELIRKGEGKDERIK